MEALELLFRDAVLLGVVLLGIVLLGILLLGIGGNPMDQQLSQYLLERRFILLQSRQSHKSASADDWGLSVPWPPSGPSALSTHWLGPGGGPHP